jgi:hypothetical protein
VIQGTFGVIQGTFGVIQGTFGVIQGTFGVIQGTFGVIQGTVRGAVACARRRLAALASDSPTALAFPSSTFREHSA